MRILALLHIYSMVLDVQGVFTASNPLPAPDNVTLLSNNFNHVLIWSPGRGTPPGTVYSINVQKRRTVKTNKTLIDISRYMPELNRQYTVRLSAVFGDRSSPAVERSITPYIETIIGPPAVTISGCGSCFNISVSLPVREDLRDPMSFYRGIKFCFHLRKTATEKVITVPKTCPVSQKQSTMLYNCFVENLQLGGNYCVQAQPLLNVNENTRTSDWFCAFTSTVEERGVGFIAGWTVCSVLAGLCSLIITFSLVYTRSVCRWRMDLPKALTAVVSAHYLTAEETQLSVAEADTSVKPNKTKQVLQTQTDHLIKDSTEQTDGEEDDDEDGGDDNNDEEEISNCNYMDRGINNSDSQATNSGQSSTSTATTLCEVEENSGRCIEEFPAAEAEPAPPSSTALSQLLHQHLTGNTQVTSADLRPEKPNLPILKEMGPGGGGINRAEAETDHNISLSSVRLMSLPTTAGDVSQPLVLLLKPEPAEHRLDLPKPQTGKPTLLGLHTHSDFQRNTHTDSRNEELPKQKDLPELRSQQDCRQTRYMTTHTAELHSETDCLLEKHNMEKEEEDDDDDEEEEEEEEEEEDCSSGYMKR